MSDVRKSSKRSAKVTEAGSTKRAVKTKRGLHPPAAETDLEHRGSLTVVAPTLDPSADPETQIRIEYVTESDDAPIIPPPAAPRDPAESDTAHAAAAVTHDTFPHPPDPPPTSSAAPVAPPSTSPASPVMEYQPVATATIHSAPGTATTTPPPPAPRAIRSRYCRARLPRPRHPAPARLCARPAAPV